MKSRNVRTTTALVTFGLFVALAGLIAPSAVGATKLHLAFKVDRQPTNAVRNQLITSSAFNVTGLPVQVELLDEANNVVTNTRVSVKLQLAGNGPGSAVLTAPAQTTSNGVATFTTLSIDTLNEPEFTSYRLKPVSAKGPLITGDLSAEFDIWGTASNCGAVTSCEVAINHHLSGGDPLSTSTYRATTGTGGGNVSASTLAEGLLPELACEGYEPFFSDTIFVNASTDTGAVFVSTHITRKDMKAVANNGQAHIEWCVGLKDQQPWLDNGAENVQEFTVNGEPFFVALAPPCPSQSPQDSAPCISAQSGDGAGGSITEGYLPAGDPPRRT